MIDLVIDEEFLDKKEHFQDAQSLINCLRQAAIEGKLPEDFIDIKDAYELVQEHKIARFWTAQLYEILLANRALYIFKEISQNAQPKDQIERLQFASSDSRLQKFVYPNESNGLQFIFPSYFLRYFNKIEEHFLELLPKAHGEVLHEIICKFAEDPNAEIIGSACKAYFDIGSAMAKFYKDLGALDSAVIHWSLHGSNMLYDSESRLVTLIDNDAVIKSLKEPAHIGRDIATLFAISPYVISFTYEDFFEKIDLTRWYTITLTSFMFGFLSTYEQSERAAIFIQLKDLLLKWDTYFNKKDIKKAKKAIKNVLIKNSENDNNLEAQYIEQGKSELEIIEQNFDLETLKYLLLK